MLVYTFLLCCFGAASAFYPLNTFNNNTGFQKLNVEIGSYLYISSNDNSALLDEMFIYNGLDMKSASEIAKLGNNADGTKIGWRIASKQIVVQSFNYEQEAAELTGYIYVPTLEQTQDKNFLIYEVGSSITIGKDNVDYTLVFLNLNLGLTRNPIYIPQMSTNVQLFPKKNSAIKMYWNEPSATWNKPNTQLIDPELFFSNPVMVDKMRFFDSVEPMQVNRKIWYLKGSGNIYLTVAPMWVDPNGWSTGAPTTTGLVMNEFAIENLTIYMKNNINNYGMSGFQVKYTLINPITISLEGGGGYSLTTRTTTGDVTTNQESGLIDVSSDWIKVNSPFQVVGIYGVQYYSIEEGPLPYTPTLKSTLGTTSGGIEATTKLSTKLSFLSTFVALLFQTLLILL